MTERHSAKILGGMALAIALATAGCRSGTGATSYQVRWARPGDKAADQSKLAKSDAKADIVQAGADSKDGTGSIETAKAETKPRVEPETPPEKRSGWKNLLGLNHDRVRLPRTDLSEDDDTVDAGPAANEF